MGLDPNGQFRGWERPHFSTRSVKSVSLVFHLLTCLELYEGVLIPPLTFLNPASSGEVFLGPLLLDDSTVIKLNSCAPRVGVFFLDL